MKKGIFYVETTLNGYIIKKILIREFKAGADNAGELTFKLDDKTIEYYEEIAGDWDDLDLFLQHGNTGHCLDYEDALSIKSNVYLEYYKTLVLGYYEGKFVGIMVDKIDEKS